MSTTPDRTRDDRAAELTADDLTPEDGETTEIVGGRTRPNDGPYRMR